jgi:hypothetical protein
MITKFCNVPRSFGKDVTIDNRPVDVDLASFPFDSLDIIIANREGPDRQSFPRPKSGTLIKLARYRDKLFAQPCINLFLGKKLPFPCEVQSSKGHILGCGVSAVFQGDLSIPNRIFPVLVGDDAKFQTNGGNVSSLSGNERLAVNVISIYHGTKGKAGDQSISYQSPEGPFSPRYILLLPSLLVVGLGFILLEKSTKSHSNGGIVMMFGGWGLAFMGIAVLLFRVILNQA